VAAEREMMLCLQLFGILDGASPGARSVNANSVHFARNGGGTRTEIRKVQGEGISVSSIVKDKTR
jgi:hypothetical protein